MTSQFRSKLGAQLIHQRYRDLLSRWPVPRRELHIPTCAGETFVLACGDEDRPPVLLLHGGGTTSALWAGCAAAWAARFRILAVDLIGEGGLSASSRPPLASEAYIAWLDDVFRGLSYERASLVGASMGAWMALDYATRRPTRVERLALLSPLGIGRQRMDFLIKVMPLLLLGDWGRRRVLRMAVGPVTPGEELMEFMAIIQQHLRPRMVAFPVLPDEALRRLSMPVLALLGGRDAIVDTAKAKRRLERLVPHADIRFLPEVGHGMVNPTVPVLEFLTNPASTD
ncbi:MAG TPA: alpha/beta hydrolase [Anaeromyxobacteraceae bacterium]|nr:alpha/beta hydrolase [Anaeromyxobacteraceae bacterium]